MFSSSRPRLRVRAEGNAAEGLDLRFEKTFRIGRVEECGVCIKNEFVSRQHVEVALEEGQWVARDLGSSNGVFVNGERVERVAVGDGVAIRLGIQGPIVTLETEKPAPVPAETESPTLSHYVNHYFAKSAPGAPAGEHTMFVRRAFAQVQAKEKRKYGLVIALLAVASLIAGGIAVFEQHQARKQRALAENMFYSMKSLDVDIAALQRLVSSSHNEIGVQEIRKFQGRRSQMESDYDQYLSSLNIYSSKLTPRQRLIMRIARVFGECELAMPPDFETEIETYIGKWQSSGRLASAIRSANQNGYTKYISQQLLAQDLPPQFFYLALQESNFDPFVSGPVTRKGIAKGMWQFIPKTALKYGLHLGPLIDLRRPDPGDDRHHWDRETVAAARYLKELYGMDAQGSGLLVMACYNWGEDSVLPLVRGMPANPRQRNFWQLLSAYRQKVPQQTYDYVFSIASAAVIGENPRLFGFDFDNPLAPAEK